MEVGVSEARANRRHMHTLRRYGQVKLLGQRHQIGLGGPIVAAT